MKRPLHLSSLFLLALGCARSAGELPPAGGQSGDDGDVVPDPNHPQDPTPPGVPGLPESPCDPEETQFAWDAPTPFGGSALELLDRLSPAAASPLFWVPFDSLPSTTFRPGPSQAGLRLSLDARSDEQVKQLRWHPKAAEATCPDDGLHLPVRVALQTSDGALDEQLEGVLEVTSGSTAHLTAELPATLDGSFAFERIGAPGENWQSEGFNLAADLWPGGSHGEIYPSFSRLGAAAPAGAAGPAQSPAQPPPATAVAPTSRGSATPAVPSQWRAIAVWPRRENCDGESRGSAAAYAASDRVIGLSLVDVVNELNSQPGWTLLFGERATPVRFTLDTPSGLQCVRPSGRSMTFDVVATVRSTGAGTPIDHLAATSVFELTATPTLAGASLEAVRWLRRDVVQQQSRAAFETATGLTLTAPAEYQELWWSWHGSETRPSADAAWSTRLELVVSSLNAAQAAELAAVVAQGGPGAGISFDEATHFPQLPGDALIRAQLSPAEIVTPSAAP